MHRVLRKDQVLTIPNMLSVFRLALIPVILWLYCKKQEYKWAVGTIVLSGVTDVIDGFIARKWNMVSDFGKILDPIADKLTQGAVLLCLTMKHKLMILLIVFFVIKEVCMLLMGYMAIRKKDSVNSAKWHGKVNTVLLYTTMILLILFPGMPQWGADALIMCCIAFMMYSFASYALFYKRLLHTGK